MFAAVPTPDAAQLEMVHRLPKARLVPRIPYVAEQARGCRVVHVGFVDAGYQEMQAEAGTWLHAHLAETASDLVGIDLDEAGVARAREEGYAAHVADCRDPEQVDALGLEPADLVIAGEVIEHLDDPGSFLDGLHRLLAPGGTLVLTTPNASGLLNGFAAMAGAEINHPDHVVLFSWRTLTNLMGRHGWEVVESATFVPAVKAAPGSGLRQRVLGWAGRFVLWLERTIGGLWAPFVADGLIVVARSTRE
jgi:SAM-dependent methyltransferase